MNQEDAEEYTQSLGQIVGGSYRQIQLAKKLGVPQALGLSLGDWVNKRLGGYVRYAAEDRRAIAKELSDEGLSQRDVGQVLGVDQATVHRDLHADANASKQEHRKAEPDANASADTVINLAARSLPLNTESDSTPETEPSDNAVAEPDESLFDLQGRDPQDFQAATQAVGAAQQMLHTINVRALVPDRVARGFLDDDARLEQFAVDLESLSKWIRQTRNLIDEENRDETRRRA